MKPRLLDLFCGAGGAAVGYHRAGFEVVGVDLVAQPNYPFEFHQEDALAAATKVGEGWTDGSGDEWWLAGDRYTGLRFDAIHASPPCQRYSKLAAMHPERKYPDLIQPTRELLLEIGLPWIIENVEGAPLARHPQLDGEIHGIELCGSMFGLGVDRGELRRHRWFESNFWIAQPACSHRRVAVGVYGHGGHTGKNRMLYRDEASEAMEIDWQTRDEMTQAIPPAYTEHIGHYLMAHLKAQELAA